MCCFVGGPYHSMQDRGWHRVVVHISPNLFIIFINQLLNDVVQEHD